MDKEEFCKNLEEQGWIRRHKLMFGNVWSKDDNTIGFFNDNIFYNNKKISEEELHKIFEF